MSAISSPGPIAYNTIMTLILSFVSLLIALVGIGLAAGFSFVLYMTQVAVLSSNKAPLKKGLVLTAGITSGLVLLGGFFLLAQPETFSVSSVWGMIDGYRTNLVDLLIGILCLIGGVHVLLRARRLVPSPIVPAPSLKGRALAGNATLFSLGFGRAVTRVSGIAALLLGVRTIIHATDAPLMRLLLVAVLLAAALLPYAIILAARVWRPALFRRIEQLLVRVKSFRPYRSVGIFLVAVGCIFILLSLLPDAK